MNELGLLTAGLACEALGTAWVKLEVIADRHALLRGTIEWSGPQSDWWTTASSCYPTPTRIRCSRDGWPTSAVRR